MHYAYQCATDRISCTLRVLVQRIGCIQCTHRNMCYGMQPDQAMFIRHPADTDTAALSSISAPLALTGPLTA